MSWNPFKRTPQIDPARVTPSPATSVPVTTAPTPPPAAAAPHPHRSEPRSASSPLEILLVEDNPNDVELMTEALIESKVANRINVARDGVEAMDYLNQRGAFATALLPDIVFLDLNMPRKNGREVLAEVKADPKLKHIPVVVLTTSKAEEDILRSYRLQAASYVVKPVDFQQFVGVMKAIDHFWFNAVTYSGRG